MLPSLEPAARAERSDVGRYRVSMDIGGTFTDVVAYDEELGTYTAGKASTTPSELTDGVFAGLAQVIDSPASIAFTVHGTTVGLNAFLQRRGEKVLLLATEGAGDVYHIARGNRARLYDLHYRKPRPLVPLSDIVEIPGRLDWRGEERTPLDEAAVRAAAVRVRDEGFGAVAVALLFSFLDPAHELRVEEILRDEVDGVAVSLSHRVAREWREYERTSSAVVEAYTAPVIRRYLGRLQDEMKSQGLTVPLHVMQSSGGVVTAESARERPLQTLLSGPVGGTMGLVALARTLGRPNLIGVDMGGTSFDVSLVINGKPDVSTETSLEGFPLLMPIANIHTIGAGGGSLAYAEAGGLRVGPESAGADPGPACYGRGGDRPDRHRRQPRPRPHRPRHVRRRSHDPRPRRRARRRVAARRRARTRRLRPGGGDRVGDQREDGAGDSHAHGRAGDRAARLRPRRLRRRWADARGVPGAGARNRRGDRAAPRGRVLGVGDAGDRAPPGLHAPVLPPGQRSRSRRARA